MAEQNMLITGHRGSAHITPVQAAALNSGLAGGNSYRLIPPNFNYATSREYDVTADRPHDFTIVDSNHVQVPESQYLWSGRHVIIPSPQTLTIDSGQSGQNRIDLICLHYTYPSNDSEETVEPVIVKGTPTSGNPSEPSPGNDYIGYGNYAREAWLRIGGIRVTGLSAEITDSAGDLPLLGTLASVTAAQRKAAVDVSGLVSLVNPQYWSVQHMSAVLHNNKTVTLNAHIIRQSFPLDNPQAWFTEQVFHLHDSIKCPQELHIPAVSNASNSSGLYAYLTGNTCGLRKIDGSVSLGIGGWVEYSATWNIN